MVCLYHAVQHGYEPEYQEPTGATLKRLRDRFRYARTVVIDEVSMVSAKMLNYIHRRLCGISENTTNYFGGFNIIVLGDFFQLKPCRGKFAVFKPFFLDANF